MLSSCTDNKLLVFERNDLKADDQTDDVYFGNEAKRRVCKLSGIKNLFLYQRMVNDTRR